MSSVVILVVAFLVGTVPFRNILSRFLTPNRAVVVAFIFDALKSILPIVLLSAPVLQSTREALSRVLDGTFLGVANSGNPLFLHLTALFVYLGNCFSPWMNFKGGRGVAVAFGCLLALSPISAAMACCGFLLTFFSKRIISLATLVGVALAAVTYLVLEPSGAELAVDIVFLLLFLSRYESNIDALLEDREKAYVWKG